MPAPRRSLRPWLVTALTAVVAVSLAIPAAAGKPAPSAVDVHWDANCHAEVEVAVSKAGQRVAAVVVGHDGAESVMMEGRWLNGAIGTTSVAPGGPGPDRTVTVTMVDQHDRVVFTETVTGTCEPVTARPT